MNSLTNYGFTASDFQSHKFRENDTFTDIRVREMEAIKHGNINYGSTGLQPSILFRLTLETRLFEYPFSKSRLSVCDQILRSRKSQVQLSSETRLRLRTVKYVVTYEVRA
ncbi:unnamed protein product [Rhizophagus irregularis]|uniref:Uncharacterized protein n=1 Tax=Rhizophagus irregularis TaxID=588596 RepID=A0A916DXI3_9GLOM|nr:unnamed protein product [Rhizophagus irregularis]